ncbi:MAG: YbgA family protein [Actinoallomurus sp.]
MRPHIGISARLLDQEGRAGGGRFLTDELGPYVRWAPYATEVEAGLGAHGEIPAGLDGYVVTAEPRGAPGRGRFAERLMAAFPLLPVEDDERLDDPGLRERFVERIFARVRLRELFASPWRPRDLVDFHTRHKLQILAHDPDRYRRAGRIVAQGGHRTRDETEADYRRVFGEALARDVTRGRNTNAMHHAFSQISECLDDTRRHDVLDKIEAYRRGELPLSVPIVLLARQATGGSLRWTAEQTYLDPFPADLCPRDA